MFETAMLYFEDIPLTHTYYLSLTGVLLTRACRCCMCMAFQEWGFTVPI